MTASTPLLITFGIYLLAMVGIGLAAWRSTSNLDDYILGGRSLGGFVTALSAGASDMSGWLLMGLPGALFLTGVSEAWIAIGLCVGAWMNWRFVAGPLRFYTERTDNALTLPDYFTTRFAANGKLLRNTSVVNLLDGCALSLPCQRDGELPVGLMVWAGALADDAVLSASLAIEAALRGER